MRISLPTLCFGLIICMIGAREHSPSPHPRTTATLTPRSSVAPSKTRQPTAAPAPTKLLTPLKATATPPSKSAAPTRTDAAHAAQRDATAQSMVGLLDAYRTALATYHTPDTQTFLYTIDQAGDRGLSQTHLIYRDGPMVRDETVALGALSIKPHIHIYKSRARHYTIEGTAPKLTAYRFLYVGSRTDGPRKFHTFSTLPIGQPGRFAVTSVEIDEKRALPTVITFRSKGPVINGEGTLRFGAIENAWVILSAEATGRNGKNTLRERLNFTGYHFPGSLPSSTFGLNSTTSDRLLP